MNYTSWHKPYQIQRVDSEGVAFTDGSGPLDVARDLITVDYLVGVARGERVNLLGSNALLFSDWRWSISAPLVVEVRIEAQRYGRIVDTVVQLTNGAKPGANVADQDMENSKTYSGTLKDFWRATVDTSSSNFGVILDFAPRADMPSSNPLILRSVLMRLGY